jgi:hypothetical protein
MSRLLFLSWLLVCFPCLAEARALASEAVPEPLKPWIGWVLHDERTIACPFLYNEERRQCRWPSRLYLEADSRGARFSQDWLLYGEGWALLPGDARHWPREVEIDGQPVVVTEREGLPAVFLAPGNYRLSGEFTWDKRPEFLQVPAICALISLRLDGETVPLPVFDEQGRLWLRGKGGLTGEAEENRLELRVFRHILDGIPLQTTTRLELDIGGKAREVLLGPVLDSRDVVPMRLDSPLPARLEADGKLRLQVRPGSWVLTLQARHQGALDTLAPPPAEAPWPNEEVWVFAAQNHLRQVEVSGGLAVDPQQTGLPGEWKNLPAYRLKAGERLELLEKRRGDPEPAPDRLNLNRQFWLDFDGQGYTVQDRINGQMSQGWRLEMAAPGKLGRVSVDGQDQFITRLPGGGIGVEVRRGEIALSADSRLEEATSRLPAVGWQHDFQQVSASLHLPPGWHLWYASGADNVPNTWIKRWTLLDLFVVLITALAIAKLWNWRWGLLALLALVLIWHESDAPRWIWLNILAAMALLRVLPAERWFTRLALLYRNLALLALLIIALPFMVQEVRSGLFPQLEYPWRRVAPEFSHIERRDTFAADEETQADSGMVAQMPANEPGFALQAPMSMPKVKPVPRTAPALTGGENIYRDKARSASGKNMLQIDPQAQVQTGPGLPLWQWRRVEMSWNGPVQDDQAIQLYLLSPTHNLILSLARVLLLAGLLVFLLRAARERPALAQEETGASSPPGEGAGTRLAVLLLLCCFPLLALAGGAEKIALSENLRQDQAGSPFPSDKRLGELKERLLAAPDCVPYCAAVPRMHLELRPDHLRLFLEVHAESPTAVPLPGQAGQWLAQEVWLDQQPAQALLRQPSGQLWLNLPAGIHQVQMAGNLPARAGLQLALPLKPHRVTLESEGWQVEGIHENGLADNQLQFTRESGEGRAEELEIGQLPPFVTVERTLLLGLEWQVETTVRRLTPPGSAVVLEIPLLPGESVTSEKPRVEGGKALINLSPWESETTWLSVFPKQETIELIAPESHAWSEIWKIDASAIWHLQASGIPVIHHQDQGRWLPEWRPWPGERVSLAVISPEGVAGQISTIDASELQVRPSQRATDYLLQFSLRSSWGGQHTVLLPEGAELQSVHIDSQSQPIRQEGRRVTLPITPGGQTVQLAFRENTGISAYLRSSQVDLGMSSVNHRISLHVPENRWVLFAGGPRLGPAVMFWGVFLIVVLVSIGLGRVKMTPLNPWHWFLLGLALSQVEITLGLIVVAWLFLLGWRRNQDLAVWPKWKFNLFQLVLVLLSLAALSILAEAIREGLLGHPDMQITGNGSSRYLLHWYQDQIDPLSPPAWMVSLPLMAYRLLMLAWALWLAFALLRWLRWGWECFSVQALWRPIQWRWKKKQSQAASTEDRVHGA